MFPQRDVPVISKPRPGHSRSGFLGLRAAFSVFEVLRYISFPAFAGSSTLWSESGHAKAAPGPGAALAVGHSYKGDVLVSNFNAKGNLQDTGTTIVEISPQAQQRVFATTIGETSPAGMACGGVGLTTAFAVFRRGWVVVGSLPTTDGSSATATRGCLFVLDSHGSGVRTITGAKINGPWDMTAFCSR
jgi:hypothetical protein